MKNFKYAALTALLLSSMMVGCNSWNPFKKKEVVPEPPIVNVAPMDNTALGVDPVRPDTTAAQPPVVLVEDPPVVPATGDTTYTIKKKDTLWSIAARHLGDGQRYRDIIAANPGLDAKKLAVGKVIKLPPK